MLNTFVIVWRESLEALLIIGVLAAWIARQPEPGPLRRQLALGAVAGMGLAAALGVAALQARTELQGHALDLARLAVVAAAAVLMLHMAVWMHAHARHLRQALEGRAARGAWGGVAAVAGLAVAREGAETVVFLSGVGAGASADAGAAAQVLAAVAGLATATACAALLVRGARGLATRRLMQTSEWLLLVIGGALVAAAADQAIALELLAPGWDPLWDTSAWLDDGRGLGRVLADFTGYRARPCSTGLLAAAGWWGLALALRARAGRPAPPWAGAAPVAG